MQHATQVHAQYLERLPHQLRDCPALAGQLLAQIHDYTAPHKTFQAYDSLEHHG